VHFLEAMGKEGEHGAGRLNGASAFAGELLENDSGEVLRQDGIPSGKFEPPFAPCKRRFVRLPGLAQALERTHRLASPLRSEPILLVGNCLKKQLTRFLLLPRFEGRLRLLEALVRLTSRFRCFSLR